MKRTTLALILVGVSTAVAALEFHPGAYPTLTLSRISQKDLTVDLQGYVVITGRLEAVWEAGDDGLPQYPNYSIIPDTSVATKLPTVDDYRVTSIYVQNGEDALRLTVGPELAKAFAQREVLRISAAGTFKLTKVGLGVACGQMHFGAFVESITKVSQVAMNKTPAPSSFC